MISEKRFYELVSAKFGIVVTDINSGDIKIPNTKKLWNFMEKCGVYTDETIGERTVKNLYQIYKESI